jgi:hypothetical protein|tara:strand:- start:2275 stop:2454 length:180 start_codon:yes stop_codon:yes gene_type:complete
MSMRLYTYAGNVHALQSLIAAQYNDIDIEVRADVSVRVCDRMYARARSLPLCAARERRL